MIRVLRWIVAITLSCFAAFLAWVLALSFVFSSEPGWFMWKSEDYEDRCWLTSTRLVDWLFIGAIHAILLALGIAALVGASWILGRKTWAGDRGGRARVLNGAAVWATAFAVTALIDLRHYVTVWLSWADYTVEECGTTYAFPTKPIVAGVIVALAIATAAILLAITLLRRGRRRAAEGDEAPHPGITTG